MMPRDTTEPIFLAALRRKKTPRVPIWLMRQAGRYMAEYRAVREKIDFLSLCKNPKLCADVMRTAVEKTGVDAAIIFSDLLPILEPVGFSLTYTAGDGPVIGNPFRSADDFKRVRELTDIAPLDFVLETVAETRRVIPPEKAVIGFAGAPFTLAGYAIEGGSSRAFLETKKLMWRAPDVFAELLARLARSTARYLNAQIAAGAEAVQIFDSWIGVLSPEDYRRSVLPHVQRLIAAVKPNAPVIYFGAGNPALLPLFVETGADALGVDWRVEIGEARRVVGSGVALQGNLDPAVLLSDPETIRREALRLLESVGHTPGYIFNLGHGVLKETPVENVLTLVQTVQQWGGEIEN